MEREAIIAQFLGERVDDETIFVKCSNCGRLVEDGIASDEDGNPACGEC
jgi:formylmethanofuran dehydrogenase subunit E